MISLIFLPETCRNVIGNGSLGGRTIHRPIIPLLSPQESMVDAGGHRTLGGGLKSIPNPLKCLKILRRRNDSLILASNSVFYIAYSCMQAALAPLLMSRYGLDAFEAGLCFLPYGFATIIFSYAVGKLSNMLSRVCCVTQDALGD